MTDTNEPRLLDLIGGPIAWRDVDVWSCRGRNDYELLNHGSPEHVAALREYWRTNAIVDCYLADPADFDANDSDLCVAGPDVDQINWSGIDEAAALHIYIKMCRKSGLPLDRAVMALRAEWEATKDP